MKLKLRPNPIEVTSELQNWRLMMAIMGGVVLSISKKCIGMHMHSLREKLHPSGQASKF